MSEAKYNYSMQIPYALKLLDSLMLLLFKPGFTVRFPPGEGLPHSHSGEGLSKSRFRSNVNGIDDLVLWETGLATLGEVPNKVSDSQYHKHRYYLLKLLIVCCSQPLYTPLSENSVNPLTLALVYKKSRYLKSLVFSLLNCVIGYDCDGMKIPYVNF